MFLGPGSQGLQLDFFPLNFVALIGLRSKANWRHFSFRFIESLGTQLEPNLLNFGV